MATATEKRNGARRRIASWRERMRAAGLRPVQIWAPDTRSPEFLADCRRQARAIAVGDPAGKELDAFIDEVHVWPDP